jgi:ATP-dependent RNA helicase DDX27
VIEGLTQFTEIRSALAVGGLNAAMQESELRSRPDIIVGTPGRIIDLVRNSKGIDLEDIEIFVMDEADRLLEMGFTAEIEQIVKMLPINRISLLFSATMTEEVDKLIKLSLKHPMRVSVENKYNVAATLSQEFVKLKGSQDDDAEREAYLIGK